ncbi:ArgS-related anticodon-binding protein NrtL [Streptomyces sp. NBC_00344]|uniref:ArgS-related anticodon-binding protein NrtL n=1 Tax=Streptomyces sp. NBC_00344 TaxID=2975720 RepID=UPI002E1A5003
MTPAELSCAVTRAVRRAVDEGALRVAVPEHVRVERPRPGGRGDYATNAALRLAGPAGMPPRAVAEALRERIAGTRGIERVEITGPGFLNFTLVPDGAGTVVRRVIEQSARYGRGARTTGAAPTSVLARTTGPARTTNPAPSTVPAGTTDPAGPPLSANSTTAGPAATLHPVQLERLGPDAACWDSLLGGGEQLLVRRESNPLFRVQYAYARSRALLRNAEDLGFRAAQDEDGVRAPALLAALTDFPAFAEAADAEGAHAHAEAAPGTAGGTGAAQRLARHLVAVADAFLEFHVTVLPVGDEKPSAAHRSRLALAEAAGTVLAGGLSLLGISAPEHI